MKFRARLKFLAALAAVACSSEPTDGGDLLVVSQIDVQPPGVSIVVGGSQQLTATPKTSSGITVPNRTVTWTSSDQGIASVSNSGLVTGVASGPATITARVDDITADVSVTVTPKPVASVSVEPPQATLTIGSTQQLLATPRDAQGQALQDRPVTFQTDNPAVATVSTTGLVLAVATGSTIIRASSEGRTGTSAITVAPRPAARLVFTTQPGNGTAGQALSPIRVAVQDENGGTVADATSTITLAIADNAGGATLGGTAVVNAVAGVATFTNVVLDKVGTGYTLRASATALTPAVSGAFNIVAATGSRLAMVTQPPAFTKSGEQLSVDPVVRVADANGNPVARAGVEISVQIVGTGATLAGDLSVTTGADGTATFDNLSLAGDAGDYSLRFLATGFTDVVSSAISLSPGVAGVLGMHTQPSSTAQAGVPFAQQPVIQLRDANNNPVATAGVPVTASIASGGGTLTGVLVITTNDGGQAIFSNLAITGTAGVRTLQFSSSGIAPATSTPITITAGAATKLGITTQPSAAAGSGTAFAQQPVVEIQDAFGNPVATAGIAVTATIESGPAGTLGGTTTVVTSATGQAAFTNLSITGAAGAYTLRFSATGLTHAISTSVTLGGGSPAKLAITTQPSGSAPNDVAFPTQPVIQVTDAGGNPVSSSGIVVTAAIASGPGTLGGTVTATTDASGVATFTGLKITGTIGSRTLSFSAPSLSTATSGSVSISAGIATTFVIVTPPPASVASGATMAATVVGLQDVSSNDVDSAGVDIDVAIASGGGTLGGTTTVLTDANGHATFGDLTITGTIGDRTLGFTHGGLATATSGTINVTAGTLHHLVSVQDPSSGANDNVPLGQQPIVGARDISDNPIAGVSVGASVTAGWNLGGTTSVVTDGSGNATFTDLVITGTTGTVGLSLSAAPAAPLVFSIAFTNPELAASSTRQFFGMTMRR